jgi:hypothetical protein
MLDGCLTIISLGVKRLERGTKNVIKLSSIAFYVLLFSLGLLVFDSITLSIGILGALFALNHFLMREKP